MQMGDDRDFDWGYLKEHPFICLGGAIILGLLVFGVLLAANPPAF